MKSPHPGDSFGKKIARAHFWLNAKKRLGDHRFCVGPHLILASSEGGDIPPLLALGAEPSSIVAVERDPVAAAACGKKFPTVRIYCESLDKWSTSYVGEKLATAFFDFCGNLSAGMASTIAVVTRKHLSPGGVIGVEIFRGRERGSIKQLLNNTRSHLDSLIGDKPQSFDDARHVAIQGEINDRLCEHGKNSRYGIYPIPPGLQYVSERPDHPGSPMMIAMFRSYRAPWPMGRAALLAKLGRVALSENGGSNRLPCVVWGRGLTCADLGGGLGCSMRDAFGLSNQQVAAMLGATAGELAAWRAVATRNHYESSSGLTCQQ